MFCQPPLPFLSCVAPPKQLLSLCGIKQFHHMLWSRDIIHSCFTYWSCEYIFSGDPTGVLLFLDAKQVESLNVTFLSAEILIKIMTYKLMFIQQQFD